MCVRKIPPTYTLHCNLSLYNYEQCYNIELIILCNTYTTLNDTLNQRIPQYCQEYNDTH